MRTILIYLISCLLVTSALAGPGLSIVSVEPTPRDTDAPVTSSITINFDRPVLPSSITSMGSFWAFGRWSGSVQGSFVFSNGDQSVTLVPQNPFSAGENVTVYLSHDIQAVDTSFLRQAGYSFQFWTAAAPAPRVFVEIERMTTRTTAGVSTRSYGGIGSDLDGDGFLDITVVNEDTADLRVFMSDADGTGTYADFLQPTFPVGDRASPSEPSDFNRDGIVDICVANIDDDTVSILLGVGDGTFAAQQLVAVGDGPRGIAVLDVDGDGDTDIVNTNSFGVGDLSLLLNDGAGTFGAPTFFEGGGDGEWALASADMSGDGILDLIVGSRFSEEIYIHKGTGNGSFNLFSTQASGGQTWMLVVGDVNGDGREDVVAANSASDNGAVLFGNGIGKLDPAQTYATDSFPLATDLGDLDGDGDLDWVTSSFAGDWFLFENDGSGVFQFDQEFLAPIAASCAVLLDVDDDEDLDLALIDELQDELIVLSNGPLNECHVSQESDWFADTDGDGFGDASSVQTACSAPPDHVGDDTDCNDGNGSIWGTPGVVRELLVAGDRRTLSWDLPIDPGGSALSFDTLRSSTAHDFVTGAVCLESDDGTDLEAEELAEPVSGAIWHYLVRAENGCPAGVGSLGDDSSSVPRSGRNCP